jgi:drug/metabolite transporter (DMT)-like permease
MGREELTKGHLAAGASALMWGTTFIAIMFLFRDFQPFEVMFYRLLFGFLALVITSRHRLKGTTLKQELYFAMAGGIGITLYFVLEKIALVHTAASNVGVIISTAPFFTAILACFLLKTEKPKASFYLGFITAIIGISLISFNGVTVFNLNPLGDLLAVGAAIISGAYNILLKKISEFGYTTIQITRRTFTYALIFMLPFIFFPDFEFGVERLTNPANLFALLFLGVGASAFSYVLWNWALKVLGAVRTSVYIYAIPVVTVITAAVFLNERITWISATGTILAIAGLFISERRNSKLS